MPSASIKVSKWLKVFGCGPIGGSKTLMGSNEYNLCKYCGTLGHGQCMEVQRVVAFTGIACKRLSTQLMRQYT